MGLEQFLPISAKSLTSTVISGATTDAFDFLYSNTATSPSNTTAYPLTVPIPDGAQQILAVYFHTTSDHESLSANPEGYTDGENASVLAVTWNAGGQYFGWTSGSALTINNTSIVLPALQENTSYYVTIFYL